MVSKARLALVLTGHLDQVLKDKQRESKFMNNENLRDILYDYLIAKGCIGMNKYQRNYPWYGVKLDNKTSRVIFGVYENKKRLQHKQKGEENCVGILNLRLHDKLDMKNRLQSLNEVGFQAYEDDAGAGNWILVPIKEQDLSNQYKLDRIIDFCMYRYRSIKR